MADTDAPRDLYRRWINELWNGDPANAGDVAGELVHDDFVGHWPDRDVKGPRRLAELVAETHSGFDQLTFVVTVGPVADGDLVAGRWAGEGENAEGPATFFGNDILRIEQGKVVEYWTATAQAPHPGEPGGPARPRLATDADSDADGAEGDADSAEGDADSAADGQDSDS